MEIKNKVTVTRGEGYNGGKKEKGHLETRIKDTWRKPKEGRIEDGRFCQVGWG